VHTDNGRDDDPLLDRFSTLDNRLASKVLHTYRFQPRNSVEWTLLRWIARRRETGTDSPSECGSPPPTARRAQAFDVPSCGRRAARLVRRPRLPAAHHCHGPSASALDAVTGVTNNKKHVRKVIAVGLSLAVQAAALSAPLVHAHPDDHATEHHDARAVHTHWAGHARSSHSSDAPALGTDDHDRAVFLNVFVAVAASSFPAPGVTHLVFELPVPGERAAQRDLEMLHSHDPPFFRSVSSRAPPAFLS